MRRPRLLAGISLLALLALVGGAVIAARNGRPLTAGLPACVNFVHAPEMSEYEYPRHPDDVAGLLPRALFHDFNGDKQWDVAVAGGPLGGAAVYLGKGDGTFQAPDKYTTRGLGSDANHQSVATDVTLGDMNKDGKVDLMVSLQNAGIYGVTFLGKGNGAFDPKGIALGPRGADASLIALSVTEDLNRDGKADLLGMSANKLLGFLGEGDGRFRDPVVTDTFTPSGITASQNIRIWPTTLNSDGIVDVVYSGANGVPDVRLGNNDGTFGNRIPLPWNFSYPVRDFILTDLNGDHQPDIAMAVDAPNAPNVTVFSGKNDGTFTLAGQYPLSITPSRMATTDINRDQWYDLVVGSPLQVLTNKKDGSFAPAVSLSTTKTAMSILGWDFTGDGMSEILLTSSLPSCSPAGAVGITILYNQTCQGATGAGQGAGMTVQQWCTQNPAQSGPDVCGPVCGDGAVAGDEECDDGNVANGDACSSACKNGAGSASSNASQTGGTNSSSTGGVNSGTNSGVDSGMQSGVNSGVDSGVESGVNSGVPSGVNSGVESGVNSGVPSGVNSGTNSGVDSGVNSGVNGGVDSVFGGTDGGSNSSGGPLLVIETPSSEEGGEGQGSSPTGTDGGSVLAATLGLQTGTPLCVADGDCAAGSCIDGLCVQLCGNGRVDAGEACDDGERNGTEGNLCSSLCTRMQGQQCLNDRDCKSGSCILQVCEECVSDAQCQSGRCVQGTCLSLMGNGRVDAGEVCDDGNRNDTDVCSNAALLGTDAQCSSDLFCASGRCQDGRCVRCTRNAECASGLCVSGACVRLCGNGRLNAGEACDDGNLVTGDGCSRFCEREKGAAPLVAGTYQQGAPTPFPGGDASPYDASVSRAFPIATSHAPAGKTGPETALLMIGGSAAGWAWMRRKRKLR